jgi:hypothetical protein
LNRDLPDRPLHASQHADIDVFNGDADGICALQQLRLRAPSPAACLVTGVKRNITLLERLGDTTGCRITVLDVSLDRNRKALEHLLSLDNRIFYADHHYSGAIPASDALEAHLDPSPLTCTSLIVDRLLSGAYRTWAIAGAFGDNIDEVALQYANTIGLDDDATAILKEIGMLLNYNGYGTEEADLHFHPADLFREVHRFSDPFAFYRDSSRLTQLRRGYEDDMAKAAQRLPDATCAGGRVFFLPEAPWAKRVIGVFANRISRDHPEMAHAVLLAQPGGSFQVSVRAPLTTRQGADTLCRQFATGGGRAAAAGINHLPEQALTTFLAAFDHHFSPQ